MKEILNNIKKTLVSVFYAVLAFIMRHKITSAVVVAVVAAILAVVIIITSIVSAPPKEDIIYSSKNDVVSDIVSVPEVESEVPVSSVESTPSSTPVSSTTTTSSAPVSAPAPAPQINTTYNYNTNTDPDNNVFLDAMVYTGYNINKHRQDNLMWVYILASQKRGKGWLSNIGYGGGCSGYETTEAGLPNIARFERGGLVCASYVTYVYFNYLPNVAGIDTSSLARPERSYDANCWYIAGKQWVNAGFSRYIDFTAGDPGIKADIRFSATEDIPIGSLICFTDYYNRNDHCTHICIYAGYMNGYHWVTHVGNDNGPEFCAIERMNRDPDPQWPLAIITTPSNIRFSAMTEVKLQDENGNGIEGVEFKIKNASGTETVLGTTDKNGVVSKEGLSYGDYTLIHSAPVGYTDDTTQMAIKLTTQNNSTNTFNLKVKKIEEIKSESSNQDNSSEIPISSGVSN